MAKTFIYSKDAGSSMTVQVNLNSAVPQGETITGVSYGAAVPATSPALVVVPSPLSLGVQDVDIDGGQDGITYAVTVTIQTNAGAHTALLVTQVVQAQQQAVPFTTQNPDAFQDLVGSLDAGGSAIGVGVFAFEPGVDPAGGSMTWELITTDGTVYSQGNIFEYKVQSTGFSNTALGRAIINVPSNVPPTLEGQHYQIRWTLQLPNLQKFYSFEGITVTGLATVPVGAAPSVEIKGTPANVSIVTDKLYDNMVLELYADDVKVGSSVIMSPGTAPQSGPKQVSSGWYYSAVIDTGAMTMNYIKPWTMVWKYWNSNLPSMVYSERADFWVILPSMSLAIADVKAKINKARTTLYGAPDLLFPASTILTWLRRAADAFNVAYGQFSYVTFVNPTGPLREFWLLYAELYAIESQYLAEGEKAFDFQGQAISLSVDKTGYLDTMASKIQSRLDNELPNIKRQLITKGQQNGDGSQDPGKLAFGATGSVGIAITPATPWTRYQGSIIGPVYAKII
ncbi:hypothetical protein D3C87_857510 [compost metagenome]